MTGGASRAAVLCVGVGQFDDRKLAPLPRTAESVRDVAKGLDGAHLGAVVTVVNPGRSDDLFVAFQKIAREAKRGALVVYFAGHVFRREQELLLCVGDSEVEGALGCVPFSDLEDLLLRELVTEALIVLNVHQPLHGATPPVVKRGGIRVVGRGHVHDPDTADARIAATAAALTSALRGSARELAPYLSDGALDGEALIRWLDARVPASLGEVFTAGAPNKLVLRDLRDEVASLPALIEAVPPAPTPEPVEARVMAAAGEAHPADGAIVVAPAPEPVVTALAPTVATPVASRTRSWLYALLALAVGAALYLFVQK